MDPNPGYPTEMTSHGYHGEIDKGPEITETRKTARECAMRFDEPNLGGTNAYLNALALISKEDVEGLLKAQESYGDSWKRRGGVGAFMMLARKWDRLEQAMTARVEAPKGGSLDRYDIFTRTMSDGRAEGLIDDIRDLRRYLLLVEGELRARGMDLKHRDNG